MGERLLSFYRTKIKSEYKTACFTTFICCLLVHLYKITNTFPNHDSLYNYYSDQNVLGSGRWALSLACGFSSYYDLPWITGLLSCLFIALTTVVITALFKLRNPVLIALSGALLATSAATAETFVFQYTADGYFLAMLLAAMGAYLTRMESTRIRANLLGGICLCLSCAIYQAYVSFALLLSIAHFIDILFQNQFSPLQRRRWIGRQILVYALSLAAYFIIWKLLLAVTRIPVNHYQGIDSVGTLSAGLLSNGLFQAVKSVLLHFLQRNPFKHGISLYGIQSLLFFLSFAAGLFIALRRSRLYRSKAALGWLALALLAIVPCACLWHFVSSSVAYRPMLLQSLTVLFILDALLFERWASPTAKDALCLFFCLVVLHNAVLTNISYFYLQLAYERTYADLLQMVIRIREEQARQPFDQIAILGRRKERQAWLNTPAESAIPTTRCIYGLDYVISQNLAYNASLALRFMDAVFDFRPKALPHDLRNQLLDRPDVKAMPNWPDHGSMRVMGNTLILKLDDRKER